MGDQAFVLFLKYFIRYQKSIQESFIQELQNEMMVVWTLINQQSDALIFQISAKQQYIINISDMENSQKLAIQLMVEEIGKQKIFACFSNSQVLHFLKARGGLINFLQQISSEQLSQAAQQKKIQQIKQERQKRYKFNVLDQSVQWLRKHCQTHGLISRLDERHRSHHELGMLLVNLFPDKFYVGNRSTHFNNAKKIERMYGIVRQNSQQDQQDQQDEELQQQDQIERADGVGSNEQQRKQNHEQNDNFIVGDSEQIEQQSDNIINDEQEESDYSISQQQQHFNQSQQNRIKRKRRSKNKQIKKKNAGLKDKKNKRGQHLKRFEKSKESQNQDQIYVQEYEIANIKQQKTTSKQNKKQQQPQPQPQPKLQAQSSINRINPTNKKRTLDSDEQK